MTNKHEKNHLNPLKKKDRDQAIEFANAQILEATKELQKQLFARSIPSPLQTEGQRAAKCQHDAEQVFEALRLDVRRSLKCYEQYAIQLERKELKLLMDKIFDKMEKFGKQEEVPLLVAEDLDLLDVIATRTFVERHLKEASCMWRLIILLQPTNSRAWVGWAMAEYKSEHIDIVDHIYSLGRELLPYDTYLALFAADFYLIQNKVATSREIIHKTINILKGIEGIQQDSFDLLNAKLVEIEEASR